MPLVIPGITDTSGGKTAEWVSNTPGNIAYSMHAWTNKLVGKKLSDESHTETNFCKKDLPEKCRVIEPGMMVTKDFEPERLNVHLNEDGTVSHVQHG